MRTHALTFFSILACPAAAVAALTPLFDYPFPASYAGTENEPVIDQSTAHNDAQAIARFGELMLSLSEDVPAGAAAGTKSLDLAAVNGSIRTNATALLDRTRVAKAGGFTMDVWFKGVPAATTATSTQKIMDDTGTDFIGVRGADGDLDGKSREVAIRLGTTANTFYLDEDDGLLMDDWNHITYSFIVTDGTNSAQPTGDVNVVLNGVTRTFPGKTMGSNSSYLGFNRPASIGRHPTSTGGEHFLGLIYHPSQYLGTAREPSISVSRSADNLEITFDGVLQSSPDLSEWSDVTGAVSPHSVPLAERGFFRARR